MADTPPPSAPDDPVPPDSSPRRSLPRAARLSRMSPSVDTPPAAAPAPASAPAAPAEEPAVATPAATPPSPSPSGGVRVVELVAGAAPTPSPAVRAAQQAAARAAGKPASTAVTFKPLQDSLATRSAIISIIGLLLCFFPLFSLLGLVTGFVARRRIQRSAGQLIGTGSAALGILLGAAGFAIGVTADVVFLLRR